MIGSSLGRPSETGAAHGSQRDFYSEEEREFCVAVDRWKQKTGTRFPALSEYLTIIRQLGYRKGDTQRPTKVFMLNGKKRCPVCAGEFPAAPPYFHRDVHKRDGLASVCAVCRRARMNTQSHKRKLQNLNPENP